jgi:molybdopterin-guanine dinucleotide biosynthesis protein B
MQRVCVVGPSDSGKTTLVEALLDALAGAAPVATVKSIHHDIDPDTPGTDTHRHRTAGADTAVGLTPSYAFEITPGGKRAAESERALLAATLDRLEREGYAIALVEGFHDAPYPKIVLGDRDVTPPVAVRGSLAALDVDALAAAIADGTLGEE